MQELQQKYTDRNIETKLKGDKLIFTKSGNIYWNKVGPLPTADEVISNEPVKMRISIGNTIEDNGNRFASYASTADSFRQVRMSLINIMSINSAYPVPPTISMHTVSRVVMAPHMRGQRTTVKLVRGVHCCEHLRKTTIKLLLLLWQDSLEAKSAHADFRISRTRECLR